MKKRKLMDMLNPKSWGVRLIDMDSSTPQTNALEIYRQMPNGEHLIGRLFRDNSGYVFRYDTDYDSDPISAFPSLDQEYRSEHLWPFFAARIPPFDREDVQREMSNLELSEDQIIDILGSLARVSVTSPYEFRACNE